MGTALRQQHMCECEECRSLWGAPAYLVNVFEFLDKRLLTERRGRHALDVLIGIRPRALSVGAPTSSISSCRGENTNTTLPDPSISSTNSGKSDRLCDDAAAAGNQNPLTLPARELAAQPQHVCEQGLSNASQATYPDQLPSAA